MTTPTRAELLAKLEAHPRFRPAATAWPSSSSELASKCGWKLRNPSSEPTQRSVGPRVHPSRPGRPRAWPRAIPPPINPRYNPARHEADERCGRDQACARRRAA